MYCFRENSNFPFSNQTIITLGLILVSSKKKAYKPRLKNFEKRARRIKYYTLGFQKEALRLK